MELAGKMGLAGFGALRQVESGTLVQPNAASGRKNVTRRIKSWRLAARGRSRIGRNPSSQVLDSNRQDVADLTQKVLLPRAARCILTVLDSPKWPHSVDKRRRRQWAVHRPHSRSPWI